MNSALWVTSQLYRHYEWQDTDPNEWSRTLANFDPFVFATPCWQIKDRQ